MGKPQSPDCKPLTFGSVCSGIEAVSQAWEPMGFVPVFFAEIEAFPSAVLKAKYPNVPNLGDMTKIDGEAWRGKIDILVGGTPCQAFSVAGLRQSLADDRGNLSLVFVRLADAIGAKLVVWENVLGVLSTADNAFGCFIGALAGADSPLIPPRGCRWTDAGVAYGTKRRIAWRTLDAQYFGLAQRRKRVFVVASTPEGPDPAEILFEREGLQRNFAPSREAGQRVTPAVEARLGDGGYGHDFDTGGGLSAALTGNCDSPDRGDSAMVSQLVTHSLSADGFDASEDGTGRGTPIIPEVVGALNDGAHFGGGQNGQDAYSGRIIPVLDGKEPVSRPRSRDVHRGEIE